jgi:hypothetical protein
MVNAVVLAAQINGIVVPSLKKTAQAGFSMYVDPSVTVKIVPVVVTPVPVVSVTVPESEVQDD